MNLQLNTDRINAREEDVGGKKIAFPHRQRGIYKIPIKILFFFIKIT